MEFKMKKLMIATVMTVFTGSAMAEINCTARKGVEAIDIKVIDTFLERTAFISRTHPTVKFPTVEVAVKSLEKTKSITFINDLQGFELIIDKRWPERRMPPIYKGLLNFGEISTDMDCIME